MQTSWFFGSLKFMNRNIYYKKVGINFNANKENYFIIQNLVSWYKIFG